LRKIGLNCAIVQFAQDYKNIAKISFVTGPDGMGTVGLLAPGLEDVVVFDKFEVDGEDIIRRSLDSRLDEFMTDLKFIRPH